MERVSDGVMPMLNWRLKRSFAVKFERWRILVGFVIFYIVCFLSFINSILHKDWINAYAIASPVIIYVMAYLLDILQCPRVNDKVGISSDEEDSDQGIGLMCLLYAIPIVGSVGFILFGSEMLHHKFPLCLVIVSCIVVVWLLISHISTWFASYRRNGD